MVKTMAVFGCLAMLALMLPACAPIRQRVDISRGGVVGNSQQKINKTNPAKSSSSTNSTVKGGEPWSGELEGLASWYGADFNGHLTASGEVYDMYAMTAAHKTLPLGTKVKVHNLESGKTVQVRINDRGPYVEGRVIDLSRKAARDLGMRDQGTVKVKVEILKLPESGAKN